MFLRNLHISPDFLVMYKNGLVRMLGITTQVYAVSFPQLWMSQTGQQITTIQILPNISKSKSNQTMKFVQLIEYSIRNAFLEKFYKKSKLNRCLDQQTEKL